MWKGLDVEQKPEEESGIDKFVDQKTNNDQNNQRLNLLSKWKNDPKNSRSSFLFKNKKDVAELKQEITPQFSSEVQNIVNEVNNTEFDGNSKWREIWKNILFALQEKDRKGVFTWVVDLFKSLLWWSVTKTKKWWNSKWNNRQWKEDLFTTKDIDWLLQKIKSEHSLWKKNILARLISRRKDAECKSNILTEPEKTLDLLNHHTKSGRIKVGDVINFAWTTYNTAWKTKELALQWIIWSDRTHSAIITSLEPLNITHASQKWVKSEPLIDYLKEYKEITYSIIQWWWKPAVDYAVAQEWKKYDAKNAVKWTFWDESEQFCSELTIRALWKSWSLNIDPDKCEAKWEVFPHHLFSLTYPKYVNEYPIETS